MIAASRHIVCQALFVLMAFLPVVAHADIDGWTKELDDFGFWAIRTSEPRLRVELVTHGGIPRLEAFEPVPERPDLWRLRYYAGTAGTSFMVSFHRAAIIDIEAGRVLGDGMLSLEPQDGSDWDQPVWEWADRFVIVHDPDWGYDLFQTQGPWFQDYAVEPERFPETTPLKTDPDAPEFMRDALADAAGKHANFAGRYRLVTWGCGSGCAAGAIIDKGSGAVTELPFAAHRQFGTIYNPIQFREDSRLLIVSGSLNEERDGTFYFLWDGQDLRELR